MGRRIQSRHFGFLDDELIDIAVDRARPLELPPRPGVFYKAYVDASGGAAGGDAYTIAITHREGGCYILDCVRGRAGPFDPEELTKEYAALCKQYRCSGVTGDKYAREWVSSAWRKCGIPYATAALTASETYLEALPLWTQGRVRIPDHPTLLRELRLLERIPTRLGKDQVMHPRNCHDDYANVCFGALYGFANQSVLMRIAGQGVPRRRRARCGAVVLPNASRAASRSVTAQIRPARSAGSAAG